MVILKKSAGFLTVLFLILLFLASSIAAQEDDVYSLGYGRSTVVQPVPEFSVLGAVASIVLVSIVVIFSRKLF